LFRIVQPHTEAMKLPIVLTILVGIFVADAQTVRVRNQPVDLSAVLQWLQSQEGERPMPHWRVIQIEMLLGAAWGGHRVAAAIEGDRRQIVIQSIPRELVAAFERERATVDAMARIEQEIERLDRLNRDIDRLLQQSVRDLSATYEVSQAQRLANEHAIRDLEISHTQLAREHRVTAALQDLRVLAYFTGQTISAGLHLGELQIWDCGVGAVLLDPETLQPRVPHSLAPQSPAPPGVPPLTLPPPALPPPSPPALPQPSP
jgi:hypothetical protein